MVQQEVGYRISDSPSDNPTIKKSDNPLPVRALIRGLFFCRKLLELMSWLRTQKKLTLVLWGEGEMNIVWQNSSKCYLQFVHKKDKYIPQEFQKFWQNAISLDFQFEKGQYVLCTSHAMWINSTHFFFTLWKNNLAFLLEWRNFKKTFEVVLFFLF